MIVDAAVFAVPNTDQVWAAVVCKGQLRQNEILELCREMKAKLMRKLAVTLMS
jgi:hypothetical protein